MPDEYDLHLGLALRRRRRLVGLSQAQLGVACGGRSQQIQKYECGANRISAVMLWKLAAALGVDVAVFYQGMDLVVAVDRGAGRRLRTGT